MKRKVFIIEKPGIKGIRIDRFIAEELGMFSRSQIKQRNLRVFLDGRPIKFSKQVSTGDKIELRYEEIEFPEIVPEKVDLNIIFENKDVIVVDKPQGMVVHPANGNYSGTLVNALLYYSEILRNNFKDEKLRPGIVHRLDKDTSGVIIVAKNMDSHAFLSSQFKDRLTRKTYLAVVKGKPREKMGTIETNITRDPDNRKKFTTSSNRGKYSLTEYKIIRETGSHSFVKLLPGSGRTHQLRVHMLSIGCPILGDPVYGRKSKLHPEITMMLHAYKLEIILPGEIKKRSFHAPLPERFKNYLFLKK